MNTTTTTLMQRYMQSTQWLEYMGMPLLVLLMRLWIARIFWYSGLTKISDWNATLFLFGEEYKVPLIPTEIAAYLATATELTCPLLLLIGFATRFATLPLLAMTAVIQFTYLSFIDHAYWAMLLATILMYGPGVLSLDYLIKKKFLIIKNRYLTLD